ncbi:MAG: right-handed parallel beta-helix repeat-containing protein, partial [Cyclobacteriaceae bacterium]
MKNRQINLVLRAQCIIILSITLLHTSFSQNQYYVSASGSDSNSGLSSGESWQTIAKVNAEMSNFISGDEILFNKGDTFYGYLIINTDEITVSSYGSGDKPIISGGISFDSGWTSHSTNIWEKTLSQAPSKLNNFYKGDIRLPLGRYPNYSSNDGGFLRLESASGLTQIIDNELDDSYDWEGSDIVVRVYEYRFNRVNVTDHNGTVLSLGPGFDVPSIQPNSGYYFVNSLSTLDLEGEWFYEADSSKIYLYSSTNPNGTSFTYPNEDIVVEIDSTSDITISNVNIRFGNETNLYLTGTDNIMISNLNIGAAGGEGIHIEQSNDVEISYCQFYEVNVRSLYAFNNITNLVVEDNNFYSIGMDPAYGKEKGMYAIYNESDGAQFLRNTFDQIGGGAIVTGGKNQLIKQNYVNNALMRLEDMGGIYTNNNLGGLTTVGTIIEENIVTNCLGNSEGNFRDRHWAVGVYLDNKSKDVTVRNNTVYNCGTLCYFFNLVTGTTIFKGNTGVTANLSEVLFELYSQDNVSSNFDFSDNILVSRDTIEDHLIFNFNSTALPFDSSGVYLGNYFISPFAQENIRVSNIDGSASNEAVYNTYQFDFNRVGTNNSSKSPLIYDQNGSNEDLEFHYNPTSSDSTITLSAGKFIDVNNYSNYCGSLILPAFTSVVLLRYSDENCETPDGTLGSLEGFSVEDLSDIYCDLKWNSTANSINYDVRYKYQSDTTWFYVNNLTDTAYSIQGLTELGEYESQVRASGAGLESSWSDTIQFTTLIEATCQGPSNVLLFDILATSAGIRWSDFRVTQYENIRFRPSGGSEWIEVDSISSEEFYMSGLEENTTYEWQIQSLCQYGSTSWLPQDEFTTLSGAKIRIQPSSDNNQWMVRNTANNNISFNSNGSVILVGRSGTDACGVGVYPIQLPTDLSSSDLTEANFHVLLDNTSPVDDLIADLWAIPFRSTDVVSIDDYFDGEYAGANQDSSSLIQNSFIDPETTGNKRQVASTNGIGASELKDFVKNQYSNGAIGGEWVFLRVNPNEPEIQNRHWLDRAEDKGDGVPAMRLVYSVSSPGQPEAADSITGTYVNGEGILISWVDNSSNEDGFVVERRQNIDLATPFSVIDTVFNNVTDYLDTGIGVDSKYDYRILAFNSNGVQGCSSIFSINTFGIPAAPTAVNAILNTVDTTLTLSWVDKSSNELGFIIERSDMESSFVVIDSVSENETSFIDYDISINGEYVYRVKSYNNNGTSFYSASVKPQIIYPVIFVNADLNNVIPGSAISTSTSGTDNIWSYKTSTNGTIDGNYIESYMQLGEDCADISVVVSDSLSPANSYNIYLYFISPASQNWQVLAKLEQDSVYQAYSRNSTNIELLNDNDGVPDRLYRVLLGEVTGTSGFQVDISDDLPGSVLRAAFDGVGYQIKDKTPAPNAPDSLQATILSSSSIQLTWSDNSDDELGFVIERATSSGTFDVLDSLVSNSTSYIDSSVVGETRYYYRVYAFNLAGPSQLSSQIDTIAPYPIHFVNASLSNVSPGGAITAVVSGTDNTWSYKTTTNGTTDGNYVESYMQLGEDCPDISVLVDDSLNVLHTYNIYLYFISPSTQDWQIMAKLEGDTAYQAYSRNTAGVELLNDNDGVPDRLFRVFLGEVNGSTDFQVDISDDLPGSVVRSAFDGVGYQIKELGILPSAPTNLSVVSLSSDSIQFIWEDNSGDEDGFIIERAVSSENFSVLDTVNANVETYTDDSIMSGIQYSYRLFAYNKIGLSESSNQLDTIPPYPIYFVNADLSNVFPGGAINSSTSGIDDIWSYKTTTNGTIDGNYVESYMQLGEDCPDISVLVVDSLNPADSYNIYLYFISPSSQDWQVMAKLAQDTAYQAYSRNSSNIELINDNDGVPDRLYRVLLGEVTGSADFQVDISDDLPGSVVRAAFDGVGYQISEEGYIPNAPSSLVSNYQTSSAIQLDWNDNTDNELGFVVQRAIGSGSFVTLDTVYSDTVTFLDDTVTAGLDYSYRVFAYNLTGNSPFSNRLDLSVAYPIYFVNASLSNVVPGEDISSSTSGTDNIWSYKTTTNGTIDGNYVESYMQLGEDCPDISVLVDDSLSAINTYNIYLYFISPSTQDWQIMAKLEADTTYQAYSRNSLNIELLNDNDGVPDRLYRVLLGEVTGSTDFQVDISDDLPGSVV